ncbi:hypothetical protein HMPREF1624_05799 [Sporothrix schenckii ATCC 58251]|uniref:Uncharacterized protein n=1 Tax=Sporothrix schenckii (strain ATCC 58251 / de Perez 2211183) TaxID=1391915 RepID=U7PPQ5_SPOS1|nr:hypothetical protein HMPREF1624_05799 [Sporothrix schenckii ATCC 58251]
MLPPVDEAVLRNNPDFAALYKTLTTVILNPDGSTKAHVNAKEQAAVKEKAKEARLRAAKNHILVQAISSIAAPPPASETAGAAEGKIGGAAARRAARGGTVPRPAPLVPPPKPANDLPPDLVDLLMLLPPLLQLANGPESSSSSASTLSGEDVELLLSTPPFTSLPQHLPRIASLVSENLQTAARGLARVMNPTTNPSYLHRAVPGLPAQVVALQKAIVDTRIKLAAERHATATALLALLDLHAANLTSLIRALEAKHGPVARSLELRAAEVSLAAQAGDVDAQATRAAAVRTVYPPEAVTALRNYASHLRDSKMRLEETIRERKALLREYGIDVDADDGETDEKTKSKGRTMREMARVYREMGQQVEDVRNDLARLGRS